MSDRALGFRWTADAEGQWLCIKCTAPQRILEGLKADRQYDFDIRLHRERRSLDANALYWVLVTALAKALEISNARCHNMMLRRYGCPETFGDKLAYIVLPDTDEAEEKALEADSFHVKPTAQVREGRDGLLYRTYILLRGSSSYDTAEMSRLINGLIEDCREMGVDTTSPYERQMMDEWEKQYGKK